MYKRIVILLIGIAVLASCGYENRKGYYYDNQRFNYVRVEKFKDAKGRNINHPAQFSEPEISTILKTIEISKGSAFSKEEKIKEVFDSYAIGKITPHIVKAFSEITPQQKVGFAFLVKDPKFILRNDRLSVGSMWVEDDKLHVKFDVLYEKVTGDIDKRGYTAMRQAQKAKGLRIELDPGAGQEFGDSTRELVFDRSVYAKITEERLQVEKELAEKGIKEDVKIKVIRDKTTRERMKELDVLRKEHMISKEEYEQKRKEIMQGL